MNTLAEELSDARGQREPTLRDMLSDALQTFATKGAYEAAGEAEVILEAAIAKAKLLERPTEGDPRADVRAFLALRELDSALFQTSALNDLLLVGEDDDTHRVHDERLGDLFQQVANWLVIREGDPLEEEAKFRSSRPGCDSFAPCCTWSTRMDPTSIREKSSSASAVSSRNVSF